MLRLRSCGCSPVHHGFIPTLVSPRIGSAFLRRTYASSRYDERRPGAGRHRPSGSASKLKRNSSGNDHIRPAPDPIRDESWSSKETPGPEISWGTRERMQATDPRGSLKRLLENELLVVTRQIEMLNIFAGFEQANRYVISNELGETLGYIAEEPRGFLSMFSRQLLKTHRPFRALVLDPEGAPLLWVRRPFAWINSRMFVQRLNAYMDYTADGEPVLDTIAEAQQRWHLWRRRYDLFLRDSAKPLLSTPSTPQPEPSPNAGDTEETFVQFASVDEGLWAWDFRLRDWQGEEIANIKRTFRGFGREIFTDTDLSEEDLATRGSKPVIIRDLTTDERALVLAMAVTIDFDYFSRHSHGSGMPIFWFGDWE